MSLRTLRDNQRLGGGCGACGVYLQLESLDPD